MGRGLYLLMVDMAITELARIRHMPSLQCAVLGQVTRDRGSSMFPMSAQSQYGMVNRAVSNNFKALGRRSRYDYPQYWYEDTRQETLY